MRRYSADRILGVMAGILAAAYIGWAFSGWIPLWNPMTAAAITAWLSLHLHPEAGDIAVFTQFLGDKVISTGAFGLTHANVQRVAKQVFEVGLTFAASLTTFGCFVLLSRLREALWDTDLSSRPRTAPTLSRNLLAVLVGAVITLLSSAFLASLTLFQPLHSWVHPLGLLLPLCSHFVGFVFRLIHSSPLML
ncbi:MAG: hypothetical protein OWQ59_10105 [Alicyclobacillaceae bacterium]|nr:hypothetical protein [Alicyclobacillaceae bacterium]